MPDNRRNGYSIIFISNCALRESVNAEHINIPMLTKVNIAKKIKIGISTKFSKTKERLNNNVTKSTFKKKANTPHRLFPSNFPKIIFLNPDGDVNKTGKVPRYFSLLISAADEKHIIVQNDDKEVPKIA